jgi:hypothetical protein
MLMHQNEIAKWAVLPRRTGLLAQCHLISFRQTRWLQGGK